MVGIHNRGPRGIVLNRGQGHGWPRLIDAHGEEGWSVRFDPTDPDSIDPIAEEVNTGPYRNVSKLFITI